MNTGVQRSGATPPAARTATTEAVRPEPGMCSGRARIFPGSPWPTTSLRGDRHGRGPPRLEQKVSGDGVRALATSILSVPSGGARTRAPRSAWHVWQRRGALPVFEARTAWSPRRHRSGAEPRRSVLSIQRRYAHSSASIPHRGDRPLQAIADKNRAYGLLATRPSRPLLKGSTNNGTPFAITSTWLEPRNRPDRGVSNDRLRRPLRRATTPAAGETSRAGSTSEPGDYEAAGASSRGQPVPA